MYNITTKHYTTCEVQMTMNLVEFHRFVHRFFPLFHHTNLLYKRSREEGEKNLLGHLTLALESNYSNIAGI